MQNEAIVRLIREGDIVALERQLAATPGLARARPDGQRTLLHVATDWPGHWPNAAQTIRLLAAHGAEPSAAFLGSDRHAETPLHWAASSDDVIALDALLDAGADLEAPGSVIDGGPAMSDAVAFRQWKAARRLVERGARTTYWQAAALGLIGQVEAFLKTEPPPAPRDVTNALWNACQGGQRAVAELLLAHGADLNWIGHGNATPLDAALRDRNLELAAWLRERGARHRMELP